MIKISRLKNLERGFYMSKKNNRVILFLILVVSILNLATICGCESDNNKLKLSVVVPVYNVEKYLPECLDSLINQTYKNIQIICVNDGSTDNSLEVLNRYKEKDNRIIVVDKQNGGVSSARNAGIESSNGDYITFIDADDYVDLDAYKNCVNIINRNNADMLAFGFISEPSHESYTPFVTDKLYDPLGCLENEFDTYCSVCYKVIRRSILVDENIRFFEDVSYGEDDLFSKMVMPNAKVVVGCSNAYYHYVSRGTPTEVKYPVEKKLVSAVNRCNHLVNYYIDKDFKISYDLLLKHCLSITFERINSLDDDLKKQYYSRKVLDILDEDLLPKIENISKEDSDMISQLRDYADM